MRGAAHDGAPDEEWDAFVAAHPDGHHEQSSSYARERGRYGFRCDRVVVREAGRIVGGAQVLGRATPFGSLGLVLRAPLAREDRPEIHARVASGIDDLARRRPYSSIRVETFPTQWPTRTGLEEAGFRSSGTWAELGARPTLLVPLGPGDAELLSRMKPKGRYNVRLSERSGVTTDEGGPGCLDDFYALHLETARYQGFPVFPREYFADVLRVFGPAGRAEVFVARWRGQPIAAIVNTVVGTRSYYGWGGMSRSPEHRRRMANYLLHFRALAWARRRGCTHYDLVGRSDFKEKLGIEDGRWPLPMRKFYGGMRRVTRDVMEFAWRRRLLRRIVRGAARRLRFRVAMPY